MKNSKVIFFDMGNTLLHFHKGKSDEEKDLQGLVYLTEYLRKFNKNIQFDEVKDIFFVNWMESIEDRKITMKEYPIEVFLNEFLSRYSIKLGLNQCIEAISIFYTEYRKNVYFEDNIFEVLNSIKEMGYKIGIISNTCYYDEVMMECFKQAGIYELIDSFTFSYSLKCGKPNFRIFMTALEKMQVKAEEAIMVGDSLQSDMKPARELGMKTIWFNEKNEKLCEEIVPDLIVRNLYEIVNCLRA